MGQAIECELSGGSRVSGELPASNFPATSRAPRLPFSSLGKCSGSILFWHMSLPSGMELIPAELFLIRDGPLGGASGCVRGGPGAVREADAPADGLHLESGRRNFLTALQRAEPARFCEERRASCCIFFSFFFLPCQAAARLMNPLAQGGTSCFGFSQSRRQLSAQRRRGD